MATAILGVSLGRALLLGGAVLAGSALAGRLTAQNNAPKNAPQQQEKRQIPKRLFIDGIVASVNDSSILQSKLFATSSGAIKGAEASGQRLTLSLIRTLTIRDLLKMVGEYQMAQSARSFGNYPPDQFDMILQGAIDRDKQERVDDLGSYPALSEELARTGQTWQTYADGLRVEKLRVLAEQFAIFDRLQKQSNLYLTPRMLRETYKQYRSKFISTARAQVAIILVSGPEAEKTAQAAADYWRTGDWSAREVAAKFANVTSLLGLPARSLPGDLKTFAMAGPRGNVSPPIKAPNGAMRVAKIMVYQAAQNGQFEDPEVQARVRLIAGRKVLDEFRQQALQRARDRTEVWFYENGRRTESLSR